MFALALPNFPKLPCTQVWGKVSIKKHSSTSLWQRKQELPESCKDKDALETYSDMDRQDKKILSSLHTSHSYLLMSRTAIAVSMNAEFTIATLQEHHRFWCPAGTIGLTGGLRSIFLLCEDL